MKAANYFAAGVSITTAIGAASEGRAYLAPWGGFLCAANLWFAVQRKA